MRQKMEEIVGQRQIDILHSAYVVHSLYQQQKLGKYCDLKVLVGDKQYFVHRCILAAASAHLDSQINGLDTIQLLGVTYYGFECLLEILYSGKLKNIACLNDIRFQQIVSAADALNAETVMEYCTRERGDLMNLLLQQSTANSISSEKDSITIETEESTVDDKGSSGTNTASESEQQNLETSSEIQLQEPVLSNKDISEYRQVNNVTRPNDGIRYNEYPAAPVAAEVEVVDNNVETTEHLAVEPNTVSPQGKSLEPQPKMDYQGDVNEVSTNNNHTGMGNGSACHLCGALFPSVTELNMHMYSHVEESLFRCKICGIQFKYQSNLLKHIKLHKSDLTCHICGIEFPAQMQLHNHVHVSHRQDAGIGENENLQFYMDLDKPNPIAPPPLPKRANPTAAVQLASVQSENLKISPIAVNDINRGPNGKYNCPLCDRGFDRRWNLKCHVLIHTAARKTSGDAVNDMRYLDGGFDCPECGKSFRNLHNLRRHASSQHAMSAAALSEASESKLNEYSGNAPAKKAKVAAQRQSDISAVNQESDFKFWCTVCGRGFKRHRNLKGHMEGHHGDDSVGKFECHLCGQKFVQKESLNGHLRVHGGKMED